ncbi:MAG TPA: DnaB-like helicase C-terminal domain-containing protein [Candidatus Cloacimonadota bacterium]|nr:DnaB-like helicase C-terminal domain-containing protein [Candidatus Cloacimonadota bacterium]
MHKSLNSIFEEKPEPSFQIQGLKTGYRLLDHTLDGIKESDLVLLIAKIGDHGSIFLENIAAGLSRQYHVLLINTEKSAFDVATELRTIMMAKIEVDHDQEESSDQLNQMAKNLFIEDKARFLIDIDKTIANFKTENPEESIVLIDNFHGLFLSKEVRTYTRQQEEHEISLNLKMLTLKHNIPIILYSRIKSIDSLKKSEPPSIANIEYLMGLKCHFDKILGVHRTDYRMIEFDSDEGLTPYEIHVQVLRNGDRKSEIVKLNISDSCRFSIFEKEQ